MHCRETEQMRTQQRLSSTYCYPYPYPYYYYYYYYYDYYSVKPESQEAVSSYCTYAVCSAPPLPLMKW